MKMQTTKAVSITQRARIALCLGVAAGGLGLTASAAEFQVFADTPTSFRAIFTGADSDPFSVGSGNDYAVAQFKFWTVLVNLRGDFVDPFGNAGGFYEIQLTHSGTAVQNPLAPVVKT